MVFMTTRFLLVVGAAFTFAIILAAADLDAGKRAYDKGDYATALKELVPLADRGNGPALYLVGSMFFDGKGVKQDKHSASTFFHFAADAGSAEAELRLAMMYMAGDGVRKDDDNFVYWNRRAAEHGVPLAQYGMGSLYFVGLAENQERVTEVKQDRVTAYMWLSLCATAENLCENARKNLAREMTPRQIVDAQKATERWKSQHSQDVAK